MEDSEGAYTYEVPVEALNMELECTGFSKRKEKWYDHQIFFKAETLPAEAFAVEAETIDLKDGEYTVQVDLAGGTGESGDHITGSSSDRRSECNGCHRVEQFKL